MSGKESKPPVGKVNFEKLDPALPVEEIEVGKLNVRITEREVGLPEIEGSIERIGLIQPIVVLRLGEHKYECVVGQRRLLAVKAIKQPTIPAIIVNKMDDVTAALISLSENIHRKELPYSDKVDAVNKLYDAYTGTQEERVTKISQDIGLNRDEVIEYLSAKLVPNELQAKVDEGELTEDKAYDITTSFWPDKKKMVSVANEVGRLTNREYKRALKIGRQKPKETAEKVIEEAKKTPTTHTYKVVVTMEAHDVLEERALKRGKKMGKKLKGEDLIVQLIDKFLSEAE